MYLTPDQVEAANNKREAIKKHFLDGVRFCNECGGTGLDAYRSRDGSYSWDGISFCSNCQGIGYISWKETITEKLCPMCEGTGIYSDETCSSCNKKGVVDWVRYIRLGGKKKKKEQKND